MIDEKLKMQFSVKLKKDEKPSVIDFANMQSNFVDTVRYLIEKEIAENGVRDLNKFIPSARDDEYFNSLFKGRSIREVKTAIEEISVSKSPIYNNIDADNDYTPKEVDVEFVVSKKDDGYIQMKTEVDPKPLEFEKEPFDPDDSSDEIIPSCYDDF